MYTEGVTDILLLLLLLHPIASVLLHSLVYYRLLHLFRLLLYLLVLSCWGVWLVFFLYGLVGTLDKIFILERSYRIDTR
mgnify:CR=1 FL=1